MVDDGLEFVVGVNSQTYFAYHDVAVGLGVERLHREVESMGYTIHEVNKKVAAVNGAHFQRDRIESLVCFEIYRHHIVAVRCGQTDGVATIALMHGYQLRIEVVSNANDFFAGNRVTFRTAAVVSFRDRFQITLY